MDYLLNFRSPAYYPAGMRMVLNLIINGLPSKQLILNSVPDTLKNYSFKPYYKWITF